MYKVGECVVFKNVDELEECDVKKEILKYGKYHEFKIIVSDGYKYMLEEIGLYGLWFVHEWFYTKQELRKLKLKNIQQNNK